jgi:hypothetical protein
MSAGIPSTGSMIGSTLAAVLAAGIGSAALGLAVLLNEAGIFTAPSIYAPAGGLSGRAAIAVVAWLVAWGILHTRWKNRDVAVGRVFAWTLGLVAFSVLATFPPVWGLL